MNMEKPALFHALNTLGELMEDRDLSADLAVIGGGALLLSGELIRPTADLDVVAKVWGLRWKKSKPFSPELVEAIQDVGRALDLPYTPRDEKDWLNPGPSFLMQVGLPLGAEERATAHRFRTLTIRVLAREDLIALKVLSATSQSRHLRRRIDIGDLEQMKISERELMAALAWCSKKDGRADFMELDGWPLLRELGFEVLDA